MNTTCSPIDWQDSVKKANNKPGLAKGLLDILEKELPDMQRDIKTAFAQDQKDELAYLIHKLHGSCCYCGIPQLKQQLTKLEPAIRSMSKDELTLQIDALNKELSRITISLQTKDYLT